MTKAQRILILTGITLIACTMVFGTWYAIFDEHQTLVGMGVQLATGFMEAANGDMNASYAALDSFDVISAEYRNEVHSHGHWGMLSLILIILGLSFNRLTFTEKHCNLLAWLLSASALFFPLGVLMQIGALASIGKVFAMAGSSGMIIGLLIAATGLIRAKE